MYHNNHAAFWSASTSTEESRDNNWWTMGPTRLVIQPCLLQVLLTWAYRLTADAQPHLQTAPCVFSTGSWDPDWVPKQCFLFLVAGHQLPIPGLVNRPMHWLSSFELRSVYLARRTGVFILRKGVLMIQPGVHNAHRWAGGVISSASAVRQTDHRLPHLSSESFKLNIWFSLTFK